MPPKKAASASKATATHPSYRDMIKDAILTLKERNGSSRQALKKYVQNNNKINLVSQAAFDAQFNRAIKTGVEKGEFLQPKGPSGPVKLVKKGAGEAKPAAKPAAEKEKKTTTKAAPKTASKAASKTATKKTTTTTTTTKKTPAKATTTKKAAATKKTATKPKANITKQRKAPPAPAIVERPTILTKTKSGRITKSTAPPPTAPRKTATRKRRSTAKA